MNVDSTPSGQPNDLPVHTTRNLPLRHSRLLALTYDASWMERDYTPDLVSVLVPTYNRAHFILDCVSSVYDQTYRPIELIVVDDGSTDDTSVRLLNWKDSLPADETFNLVFLQQDQSGANIARNRGLTECKGEFIQFLDSDDLLLPSKIACAVEVLRASTADLCYCPVSYCDRNLVQMPGQIGTSGTGTELDITRYLWQTMGPLYRRDIVRRIGPWMDSIFFGDDWEYAFRVKLLASQLEYTPTPGGWLRVYPRSSEERPDRNLRELQDYLAAYTHARDFAAHHQRLTQTLRQRLGRRFLLTALQLGAEGDETGRRKSLLEARTLSGCLDPVGIAARICTILPGRATNRILASVLTRLAR